MLKATDQFFTLFSKEKTKYGNKDVLNPVRYGTSYKVKVNEFFNWRDYFNHFAYPKLHTLDNPLNYRYVLNPTFDLSA